MKHETEKATYKVTVHGGQVYKSTDANGLSDPYVRICEDNLLGKIGKTLLETPVKQKTLSPSWEYSAEFTVSKEIGKDAIVKIELLDKDMIGSDKIGSNTLVLGMSAANQTVSFTVDQHGKQFVNGEITISYTKTN